MKQVENHHTSGKQEDEGEASRTRKVAMAQTRANITVDVQEPAPHFAPPPPLPPTELSPEQMQLQRKRLVLYFQQLQAQTAAARKSDPPSDDDASCNAKSERHPYRPPQQQYEPHYAADESNISPGLVSDSACSPSNSGAASNSPQAATAAAAAASISHSNHATQLPMYTQLDYTAGAAHTLSPSHYGDPLSSPAAASSVPPSSAFDAHTPTYQQQQQTHSGRSSRKHSRPGSIISSSMDGDEGGALEYAQQQEQQQLVFGQLHPPQPHAAPPVHVSPRSDENTVALVAGHQHRRCEGDHRERPLSDRCDADLPKANYVLGCGGTIAAPLQYEEVSTTSAEGLVTTSMKPKRGQGYSCQEHKTSKRDRGERSNRVTRQLTIFCFCMCVLCCCLQAIIARRPKSLCFFSSAPPW